MITQETLLPLHTLSDERTVKGILPHELARDLRNRELFAVQPYLEQRIPKGEPSTPEEEKEYDFLFADDDVFQSHSSENRALPRQERQWRPTDETREAAEGRLIEAARNDDDMVRLIAGWADKVDIKDPMKVSDAIRENRDIRLAMGSYLLDKVRRYSRIAGAMPDRIARNTPKTPDQGGYPKVPVNMTSQEYVALLALAYLDGTFDDRAVLTTDKIDARGTLALPSLGQHRWAALHILGLPTFERSLA